MQGRLFYAFGYVSIKLQDFERKKCLDILRKANVIARFCPEGWVDISIFSWRRAKKALNNNVVFIEQCVGGACSLLPILRKHIAIPVSITLFLILYIFLSRFVFEVRVEGNETMSDEEVCEELYEAGLHIGASWKSLSFSEIEGSVLASSKQISWLNVYRKGVVAYVTVKEKQPIPPKETTEGYANIVSRCDGVIEELFVKEGSAAVSAGETVKKGDLLISAFDSKGAPTYAQGEVYARVYGSFSVFVPREETKTVSQECVLISKHLKIFDFFINIFKNYRNLPKEYVIIENKRRVLLSDGKSLPLTLIDTYMISPNKEEVVYTDEELISLAKTAHESAMLSYLSSGEIVFVRTHTELTEEGCCMKSEICMLTQIGVSVPLLAE